MTSADATGAVDYLLIGGGLASATAAEEIRKRDASGSITIVAAEPQPPYHRPPLSKEYLRAEIGAQGTYGNGGVYVQMPEWYGEQRVELLEGLAAEALDRQAHAVRLSDGRTLRYRKLLLATGGRPRALAIPGADLPGVHYLRTLADANAIREMYSGTNGHVVVIGSGFIGLETAANARFMGQHVTIIEPMPRVWSAILSPALSEYLQGHFQRRGVELWYGHAAAEIVAGENGRVSAVRMVSVLDPEAQPVELPCDLAIIGVGIQLNTELAANAGLEVDEKHGVVVNEYLQTADPDIFAAGDVAAYPDPVMGRMHFEHWDNALATGQTAAANMTGAREAYQHVPYFFSDQFDLAINMLGYPASGAQVAVRGTPLQDTFTALYVESNILRGALMVNDDAQMDLLRELIAAQTPVPEPAMLLDPLFELTSLKEGPQTSTP